MSEFTQAVTLDILKAFDRLWYAGLHKHKSNEISKVFALLFYFL